jgi:hypothetical protein
VEDGGTLNLEGGSVLYDVYAASGSEVNIRGGDIGGNGFWDITVDATANVAVYGTDFGVTNGEITTDASGTYFTADADFSFCSLTGSYEGSASEINLIFYVISSNTPIYLANSLIEVQVDIKPGSYPNSINLGSNGVIPVAILSTASFDATLIPANTVFLAGSGVAVRGKGNNTLAHEDDVNGDGLMDLVVKVETENLDPDTFQEGTAILTGETFDGVQFEGSDDIAIVPPE